MHRCRVFLLFSAAGALLLACAGPTSPPSDRELLGRWATPREDLSPSGWHQYRLTFDARGRFTREHLSFGVYSGERDDELSSYYREGGTYRTDGDRLILKPRREFSRVGDAVRFSLGRVTWPDDDMRYEVTGDQLTLRYLTFPADAPVPTTKVYFRQP
jgi:hypothetical protein